MSNEKLKAIKGVDFETNSNIGISSKATEANSIAPPPPKKQMLLKSFEEDNTTFGGQTIDLNKSENVFSSSNNSVKQPRTYLRRKNLINK